MIEVGRQSSSCCHPCVGSSAFLFLGRWGLHQSEIDGVKASIRCERKQSEVFFSSTCSSVNDEGGSSICLLMTLVEASISSSGVLH
jgi:hypothetical protein